MAGAGSKTDETSPDDERQFQEDLERARALSLESLALEQFRLQKQQQKQQKLEQLQFISNTCNVQEKRTGSEGVEKQAALKSRPRPGSFNTGGPRVPRILAPPPSAQRRNSATADLITFGSPEGSPTIRNHPCSALDELYESMGRSCSTTTLTSTVSSQSQFSLTGSQFVEDTHEHPPPRPSFLAHLINQSVPVPVGAAKASTTLVYSPVLSGRQALQSAEQVSDAKCNLDVLKVVEKRENNNLIDLTPFDNLATQTSVRGSVLEVFDPLLSNSRPEEKPSEVEIPALEESKEKIEMEVNSEYSGSFYDTYDPFDYLDGPGSACDPMYAAVVKDRTPAAASPPPPLPPRNSSVWSTIQKRKTSTERKHRVSSRLYENVRVVKRRAALHDSELQAFHFMVKKLRVSSTIEHVILHVVCELEGDVPSDVSDYVLKVWGLAEYFTSHTTLSDYEYIHQCIKLEKDIELAILHVDQVTRPLARTAQDDKRDGSLSLEDLLPNEPVHPISYDSLLILLETLEREMEKVQVAASQMCGQHIPGLMPQLQSKGVVQAVKAICALMGNVETQDITDSVEGFEGVCLQFIPAPSVENSGPEILSEDGDYSVVRLRRPLADTIATHCDRIRDAVQGLIETYCHAFRVDFQLNSRAELPTTTKQSSSVLDSVLFHVGGLHRLLPGWIQDEFLLAAQIYHGTRPVGHPVLSRACSRSRGFYDRVLFDSWLSMENTSVCMLPREARLVLVLYGRTMQPPENIGEEPRINEVELGWFAIQFFNYEGVMAQGSFLLSLWPAVADKRLGPAPSAGTRPHGDIDPVLWVELPDLGGRVMFPPQAIKIDEKTSEAQAATLHDWTSLHPNTQQQLLNIIEQDTFTRPPVEDREVLWEKRHYLHHMPQALPKILLEAHSWDWACLGDLHAMLHMWSPMEPVSAMQLLLPCFPDLEVRRVAVTWMRSLGSDELVDYLPQLVQALKHETWEVSPLAHFLLERALTSPRVAHYLYWLLAQALPGEFPQQNSSETTAEDDISIGEARYHRRLQLMLRALFSVSGEALRGRFLAQQLLVKNMYEIAENVKATKESLRLKVLSRDLEVLHHSLEEAPTCLPLSPSLEVRGVQVRTCSYFPSNTLPLKINFLSAETGIIPAIFKVGEDLQQDMLTIQMVRIMDKLWLKEGIDLKMVTFSCVPTGHNRGMIEMVTNAETLRKIQVELGLTGSFKDRSIAEWLAKHNPSALEYERAVENFTASCAGYSVATYILGICDRHNDNIMLKTSGHLFHIDFGKFLGDAQMFGNFKRDRTPFVLTSDMAYVINGGDKPTAKFHNFVDQCCTAFNVVRRHGSLLLNLFGLMASSGIPGVTLDAVRYVQRALLPELSNSEAAATFARMIESSLRSWFTQFNFFLHNLAQLRFTGDHNDGDLLSFVPRTYTMQQEGRILSVGVYGYQKRYDPEKYYVYILKVERTTQPDPTYLFRSYKEFCEFHQKLCLLFPLAKCYSLPSGLSVGRSNIKQVAERRRVDIERFLSTLFLMADEISHSDIVYTFFHPLLRDQQEANINAAKVKEPRVQRTSTYESRRVRGQLRLSLHYQRGTLMVMVHHARSLSTVAGGQEPSPYVKVYLLPDPSKVTKRKTKVVRKNCHPTFMEMVPAPYLVEGGLNASHHSWGSNSEDDRGNKIAEVCTRLNLVTLNSGEATHLSLAYGTYSMIDISICSPVLSTYFEWSVIHDLHGSDHYLIRIRMSTLRPAESRSPNWVIKKANWVGFSESISFDDNRQESVDSVVEHFSNVVIKSAELTIPRSSCWPKSFSVPWWTDACRDAI
ncbi:phosphatidylinositol 4-phosphate 3-kinase C2 domain-containing subunit beta isoform X3 [Periplaneta americana]|uniref:phosphatidylinositol 4-phosphate 3-kinase C2 domain-containing subunit beta isoform X3 n=1 Tax=Periplaneta americana TaxID=6978 RepID=UPI0037E8C3E4